MTEEAWRTAAHPDPLFALVGGPSRKLRLFGCACCRRVGHLVRFQEFVQTTELAERFADATVSEDEMRTAERKAVTAFEAANAPGIHYHPAETASIEVCGPWPVDVPPLGPSESAKRVAACARSARTREIACRNFFSLPEFPYPPKPGEIDQYLRAREEHNAADAAEQERVEALEARSQAALFRDVFGNPFRPIRSCLRITFTVTSGCHSVIALYFKQITLWDSGKL